MNLRDKNILVTGGAGFIGSHLADRLIEIGSNVTIIDDLSYGEKENMHRDAKFIKLDIRKYSEFVDVIKDIDLIYHLAASATTKESSMGWNDPIYDYQVNAIGTLNILRAIIDSDSDANLIYTSSAAVYGDPEYTPMDEEHPINPVSPYGISKLMGEKYSFACSKEYGIKSVSLRIFNTYGPRQPRYVMYDFLKKLYQNQSKLEVIGTGEQIRDYCYITDTVDAFILVATKKAYGEIYNVASGNVISIRDLAELTIKTLGLKNTKIEYSGKSWKGDINELVADASKIKKLGFNPEIDLKKGIKELIKWFKIQKYDDRSDSV